MSLRHKLVGAAALTASTALLLGAVTPGAQAAQPAADDSAVASWLPGKADQAMLERFAAALESGDTAGLSGDLAREIAEAKAKLGFMGRVRVPGAQGDMLDGFAWTHGGNKRRPAIVMPAPWADMGWTAYVAQATKFALEGYDVLAYAPRGFAKSEGMVEVAGPLDVQDGSKALDFLIAKTGRQPQKVGFLGDSYGSGISQLVAAHDTRVNAVASLSTWGDLGEAFLENGTIHTASVQALLGAAKNARLSPRTRQAFDDVLAGRNIPATLEWARERSPRTHVDKLNARGVAVFYAQAWHETLFPGNQATETFDKLTGPKRIDMSVGDHSSPEMSGLLGLPNRVWGDAHQWFAHFLKGVDNGIEKSEISSKAMWKSRKPEEKAKFKQFTTGGMRMHLRGKNGGTDGGLGLLPDTGWSIGFKTGTDTPLAVAKGIIVGGYDEMAGKPMTYPTGEVNRADAGVWTSGPMLLKTRLRGTPRLHLTYTPKTDDSSFVAHLLDVAPDGTAKMITHAPFTHRGEAGKPVKANVKLQFTGYDVPKGHRVMLAIDTKDQFYTDANGEGGGIEVSSPRGDGSFLDLPLG
ncbi:CocE/NonD family hydrolase [Streptomyces sp. NPDC001941]|uniref:CocE/NonD family hydrolase n=1 Tax=Streptomyces sp. NPDC001941 TaxID=3154659 RepID=UPI0033314AC7